MDQPEEDNIRAYKQTVEFSGQEDHHSAELYSTDVTVIPSPGGRDHGSSKVKLKNIVDFTWESKYYTGQLLAVHMSGKYLAYGLKANGVGIVRVVYKDSQQRALLRGMRGTIEDLTFAHVPNAILAIIDYTGSLFVHTIVSTASQLVCNLLLSVNANETAPSSHRVIWCPYIPDDSETDDVSKLLMVTRGSRAELWCVDNVYAQLAPGPLNIIDPNIRECGAFAEICDHTDTIIEAILSPDGTAIATASLDGEVKFFQVNIINGILQQPCCLHKWQPHNGQPVTSLFFLDDHKNYKSDAQFWRFAITGCEYNTELKIWSCEKWKCLQTIKFQPSPSSGKMPMLKAGLDLSAGYLLLSDICNKGLYILSLTKNAVDGTACVSAISEFLLNYPILSFGIVDAGIRKVRPTGESLEDLCPCEEENDEQLVIRMYLVQPKSLQECHIAFQPVRKMINNCMVMDTLTHDSLDYAEDLQHIRHEQNGIVENGEDTVAGTIESAANHSGGLNLMTPDAFSSPAKKDNNLSGSTSPELGNVMSSSPSLAQAVQALNVSDPPLATSEMDQAPPSGGSSPSREVREIFSLAEPEEDEEEEDSKALDSNDKVEENWSNIPMVLLKEVHLESEDLPEDDRRPKDSELIPREVWITENKKTEEILKLVREQQQEIQEMRSEISRLQEEFPVMSRIESAMARGFQQQLTAIEQSMYNRLARQNEFLTTIETTIKENIQLTLPRLINEAIDPLKTHMKTDVKRIDDLLRDNLTQLMCGTHIKDMVSLAVGNAAKPALDKAFKEAFVKELLPGIERACGAMFQQIQDTFGKGTREYLQYTEGMIDRSYQKRNEQQSEALSRLVREELQIEMSKGFGNIQEGMVRTIRESVRDNMGQHFSDMQARSRATTPGISAPSPADAQARVLALLQRGQLNAAFQQALSASDLGLVVLVCEKTEPSKVFTSTLGGPGQGSRCLLQQPVILSLVQQLSADLGHRTELKHKWLEEAILNLDPADPVTREHMGAVLMTLQSQLAAFIAANPVHRSTRRMKMLSMAAQALLHQHP